MKCSKFLTLLFAITFVLIACESGTENLPATTKNAPVAPESKITLTAGCSGCHGTDGVNSKFGTPFIAGLPAKYLESAMRGYRNNDRKHDVMRQAVLDLDVLEREQLASYFSGLKTPWKKNKNNQTSGTLSPDARTVRAGQALSKPCAGCHGIDGNSIKSGVPSLAGLQPAYFLPAVKAYLSGKRQGAAIMKNFKLSLSEKDLNNLAVYYQSQQRKSSPLTANLIMTVPSNALTPRCLGCHGEDGNSTHPAMPSLAGQNATYLIKAMKTYREGKRSNKMMTDVAKGLTDNDIESNATYFATRTPVKTGQNNITKNMTQKFNPLRDGAKLAASCNACHGEKGNNPNPGTPRLAGLHTVYLQNAITAYRDGARKHPMMKMLARFLSETDIEKLSLYYANQIPDSKADKSNTGKTGKGKELASACSGCHGKNGNSHKKETPSLAGQDSGYLIAAINAYKKGGSRNYKNMENAVRELNKKSIRALSQHYSQQSPVSEKPRILESAKVLSIKCDRCHGENDGRADREIPRVAGQRESYLVSTLTAYKKGDRINSIMQAMSEELWTVEIKAIATYYANR